MSTSWILVVGERYVHRLPKMLGLRLFFIISQGYSPVNGDGGHVGTGIVPTWWHCNISVLVKTQKFSAPFKR